MSQVATSHMSVDEGGQKASHDFLWRKLHSLSGILPVGAFMLFHLFENLKVVSGPAEYDKVIQGIAGLVPAPYFYGLEVGAIIVPILFHGLYGVYIAMSGESNLARYPYRRNTLYVLQRVTGAIALFYIALHVGALRIGVTLFGRGHGPHGYVTYGDVAQHLRNSWMFGIYVVGTLACIWHFTNGLNGFCFSWGITVGEKSKAWVEKLSLALFFAIAIPTLHTLFSFR